MVGFISATTFELIIAILKGIQLVVMLLQFFNAGCASDHSVTVAWC